ncbi:methionine adenosyltransferase [Benzoatithermus flavus]|uniref:Methionine adenosyltransferase n=1 Tax=Benzoatithermus flavus TaxID=3108223 RepID=A0ABU8XPH7_9PROT
MSASVEHGRWAVDGLMTAEAVSDGHPDKICDQISDAILDACLAEDPQSRVAVECAIKGSLLAIVGEITTNATIDPIALAREVLRDIGHGDGRWGLDLDGLQVLTALTRQSPEIAQGVDGADTGAGDQGLMYGFACDETPELMPLPISLAQALMRRQRTVRLTEEGAVLGPDAKAQVTVRYEEGRPVAIDTVALSTQHVAGLGLGRLRRLVEERIILPVLPEGLPGPMRLLINPAGSFVLGGPVADAGLTGRKIIVDTYGGYARHGGGAFSGKDPTKVDRSAAYGARQLAKHLVAAGWARACEVRVAYAIGRAEPVAIGVETFGTGRLPDGELLAEAVPNAPALLRTASIIQRLRLGRPIYRKTATFGHFGRADMPWENEALAG